MGRSLALLLSLASLANVLAAAATTAQNTTYGEIDVTTFPACAYANCIKSEQLSPARLGCVAPKLNADCLCRNASNPLACSPVGPSDEDNCFYQLEDWFAGTCPGAVATLQANTLPACMRDCVLNYVAMQGCRSQTRNCFCRLTSKPLVDAASSCLSSNCATRMQPTFSPQAWRDTTCSIGGASAYDQAAYDKRVAMVRDTRIGVSVVVVLAFIVALYGGLACWKGGGWVIVVLAVITLLCIEVPLFTAL